MPEKKKTEKNESNNLEKKISSLENSVNDLKKLSIANLYGKYDDDAESEVSDNLKYGVVSKNEGFVRKYFHVTFLIFSLLILAFNFMIFAVITGKGLGVLENVGIKLEPMAIAGALPSGQGANPTGPKFVEVNIDDDPILGDRNAPVTIVEFSDYDCPFCRTFFDDYYERIKEDYIETGQVRLVFRDLPLTQIHPLAYEKALAANCAREQNGDAGYYDFHDQLFGVSGREQRVLEQDDLFNIAGQLGLNVEQFTQCLSEERYADEVDNDINDAISIEAFGTPTFIIGKSNGDNDFEGRVIEGLPQTYIQFKQIIDELL